MLNGILLMDVLKLKVKSIQNKNDFYIQIYIKISSNGLLK